MTALYFGGAVVGPLALAAAGAHRAALVLLVATLALLVYEAGS